MAQRVNFFASLKNQASKKALSDTAVAVTGPTIPDTNVLNNDPLGDVSNSTAPLLNIAKVKGHRRTSSTMSTKNGNKTPNDPNTDGRAIRSPVPQNTPESLGSSSRHPSTTPTLVGTRASTAEPAAMDGRHAERTLPVPERDQRPTSIPSRRSSNSGPPVKPVRSQASLPKPPALPNDPERRSTRADFPVDASFVDVDIDGHSVDTHHERGALSRHGASIDSETCSRRRARDVDDIQSSYDDAIRDSDGVEGDDRPLKRAKAEPIDDGGIHLRSSSSGVSGQETGNQGDFDTEPLHDSGTSPPTRNVQPTPESREALRRTPNLIEEINENFGSFVDQQQDKVNELRKKWTDCTLEEWHEGGKEITSKFDALITFVRDGMKAKMEAFSAIDTRLEEHNKHLDGRDRLLQQEKQKLLQETGKVVETNGKGQQ